MVQKEDKILDRFKKEVKWEPSRFFEFEIKRYKKKLHVFALDQIKHIKYEVMLETDAFKEIGKKSKSLFMLIKNGFLQTDKQHVKFGHFFAAPNELKFMKHNVNEIEDEDLLDFLKTKNENDIKRGSVEQITEEQKNQQGHLLKLERQKSLKSIEKDDDDNKDVEKKKKVEPKKKKSKKITSLNLLGKNLSGKGAIKIERQKSDDLFDEKVKEVDPYATLDVDYETPRGKAILQLIGMDIPIQKATYAYDLKHGNVEEACLYAVTNEIKQIKKDWKDHIDNGKKAEQEAIEQAKRDKLQREKDRKLVEDPIDTTNDEDDYYFAPPAGVPMSNDDDVVFEYSNILLPGDSIVLHIRRISDYDDVNNFLIELVQLEEDEADVEEVVKVVITDEEKKSMMKLVEEVVVNNTVGSLKALTSQLEMQKKVMAGLMEEIARSNKSLKGIRKRVVSGTDLLNALGFRDVLGSLEKLIALYDLALEQEKSVSLRPNLIRANSTDREFKLKLEAMKIGNETKNLKEKQATERLIKKLTEEEAKATKKRLMEERAKLMEETKYIRKLLRKDLKKGVELSRTQYNTLLLAQHFHGKKYSCSLCKKDDFEIESIMVLDCTHNFCNKCFHKYLDMRYENDLKEIECPNTFCAHQCSTLEIKRFSKKAYKGYLEVCKRNPYEAKSVFKLPKYWEETDEDLKIHKVDRGSDEWKFVVQKFQKTLPNKQVRSVERVQNNTLHMAYALQRQTIIAKYKNDKSFSIDQMEKWVFHGTATQNVRLIAKSGLDWRFAGVNGVAFGQGNYFARDASYSLSYARGNPQQMFLCNIIPGKFCIGNSNMKRPPRIPNTDFVYDSTVNNLQNPSVYVTFTNTQAYPAYILTIA